jgi:hypothetical protein
VGDEYKHGDTQKKVEKGFRGYESPENCHPRWPGLAVVFMLIFERGHFRVVLGVFDE